MIDERSSPTISFTNILEGDKMRNFTTQSLAKYICINLYQETNLHTFIFNKDYVIIESSDKSIIGHRLNCGAFTSSKERDIMLFPAFKTIDKGGFITIRFNNQLVFYFAMEGDLAKTRTILRMIYHFVKMWLGFRERILNIEQAHKQVLENIQDGYYEVDLKGNFTYVNKALKEMLGYSEFELIGMNYRQYTTKETADFLFDIYSTVFQTRKASKMLDFQYINKSGETFNAEVSINLIYNDVNEPIGFCGIVRDITERKKTEELINFYAYHDPLTKLPNRLFFETQLIKAIKKANQTNKMLAVLFIDLDGFKYVNDTLGHSAGDKLLLQVAERLNKHSPKNTVISRLGGDEFTILLYNLEHISEVYEKTKTILELFQKQFTIDNVTFTITASIGISLYPNEGKTPEELLIYADTAMYKAKQSGKNKFCFYNYTPNIC